MLAAIGGIMQTSKLDRLCETLGIKAESTYGGVSPDWAIAGSHQYKVRLTFKRRSLTVPFFMGPAHEREPSAADVLSCLCSDVNAGEQSFEDFCSEFGYDVDSIKANKTWKACAKLAPKVRRFLGDDFYRVANAEH